MAIRGAKIRELREERGQSLAELSKRAGISLSYLSEIERGAKSPSLKTVEKLSKALNVPRNQLIEDAVDISEGISLGDKVRLLREDKAMTLSEMASRVGISVSYLSEIERGNVYPAVSTLRRIAEVLGTRASVLVGQGGILGAKLKSVREQQGMTQAELARLAGVSAGLIGQIEHGRVQPSLQTIEKISKVLGVSPCYFIQDDADIQDMLRLMPSETRELLVDSKVQSVLRLVCNMKEEELRFVLDFIKLYKRCGFEV